MSLHFTLMLIGTLLCTSTLKVFAEDYDPVVVAEWVAVNYTWTDEHSYHNYVANGNFIVENCILAGIKVDKNGLKYVTVPRWRTGVPATLNTLEYTASGDYLLKPYPDWDMQTVGTSGDLQNCQSMIIDGSNRMWVIEVGRLNFFDSDASTVVNGPAGVWIIDLETGTIESKYYFPNDVAEYNNSFVNDIVIDQSTNSKSQLTFLELETCN